MKSIILARVSTKEQEADHSIAANGSSFVDYCARKGLKELAGGLDDRFHETGLSYFAP